MPFRVVNQLGLVGTDDYATLKKQLERHYSPEGNELEWQYRLQSRQQKCSEPLSEFAGELRMLVDRAYPTWKPEQRLEMARNQFIQGLESASIQLLLMREKPKTLDLALELAQQQLSVEMAQKRLQRRTSDQSHTLAHQPDKPPSAEEPSEANALRRPAAAYGSTPRGGDLSKEIQRLSEELARLRSDLERAPPRRGPRRPRRNPAGTVCWFCNRRGHLKRDCPDFRAGGGPRVPPRFQPPLN